MRWIERFGLTESEEHVVEPTAVIVLSLITPEPVTTIVHVLHLPVLLLSVGHYITSISNQMTHYIVHIHQHLRNDVHHTADSRYMPLPPDSRYMDLANHHAAVIAGTCHRHFNLMLAPCCPPPLHEGHLHVTRIKSFGI